MLNEMKKLTHSFPYKTLEEYMKRAGITNGYQSKPCLNPKDPECPDSAPNKRSQQVSFIFPILVNLQKESPSIYFPSKQKDLCFFFCF